MGICNYRVLLRTVQPPQFDLGSPDLEVWVPNPSCPSNVNEVFEHVHFESLGINVASARRLDSPLLPYSTLLSLTRDRAWVFLVHIQRNNVTGKTFQHTDTSTSRF